MHNSSFFNTALVTGTCTIPRTTEEEQALERPENFPENYREMVSRHLMEKYGDKISIRSAIIKPPTQEKSIKGDKIIKLFKGAVSFNVVDRKDKDFGRHDMTYVIQNDAITLKEGES